MGLVTEFLTNYVQSELPPLADLEIATNPTWEMMIPASAQVVYMGEHHMDPRQNQAVIGLLRSNYGKNRFDVMALELADAVDTRQLYEQLSVRSTASGHHEVIATWLAERRLYPGPEWEETRARVLETALSKDVDLDIYGVDYANSCIRGELELNYWLHGLKMMQLKQRGETNEMFERRERFDYEYIHNRNKVMDENLAQLVDRRVIMLVGRAHLYPGQFSLPALMSERGIETAIVTMANTATNQHGQPDAWDAFDHAMAEISSAHDCLPIGVKVAANHWFYRP